MYINKFRRNRYIVIWLIPLLLLGTACNGYDQYGYSGGIETTSKVVLQESDSIGSKIDIKNDVSMPDVKNLDISAEKLFANELSVQSLDSYQVVAAQSEVLNKIYEKTLPSIVSIRVFVNNTRRSYGTTLRPQVSEGSGFIWNKDGYIVTNYHVLREANDILVTFSDGVELSARIIGTDPDSDIAVIKVQHYLPTSVQGLELGNSDAVKVGELVAAIGAPFGQEFTLTSGIVSAVGRIIKSGNSLFSVPKVIQTDAAINPGNSGGPLFDMYGRVIGINTQIISRSGGNDGVGFAIPINSVRRVVPSLIESGSYHYSWIGISGVDLTPRIAKLIGLPINTKGVLITNVNTGGPGDLAGLKATEELFRNTDSNIDFTGDIILGIDGSPVLNMSELIEYLVEFTLPGEKVTVQLMRGKATRENIEIILRARPDAT
jgi:S1-C subfamily serine protease